MFNNLFGDGRCPFTQFGGRSGYCDCIRCRMERRQPTYSSRGYDRKPTEPAPKSQPASSYNDDWLSDDKKPSQQQKGKTSGNARRKSSRGKKVPQQQPQRTQAMKGSMLFALVFLVH
jgi:hypothetical protein